MTPGGKVVRDEKDRPIGAFPVDGYALSMPDFVTVRYLGFMPPAHCPFCGSMFHVAKYHYEMTVLAGLSLAGGTLPPREVPLERNG